MEPKKDVSRIHRDEHDSESGARKVKIIDTSFKFSLNKDEDAITCHPEVLSISCTGITNEDLEVVPAIPCQSIKRVQLSAKVQKGMLDCRLVLMVSPVDSGDVWFDAGEISQFMGQSAVLDICAKRLKVVQANAKGSYVVDLYIVGQS